MLKDGEMGNDSKVCGHEGSDKGTVSDRNELACGVVEYEIYEGRNYDKIVFVPPSACHLIRFR